jgi:hypothetical protein
MNLGVPTQVNVSNGISTNFAAKFSGAGVPIWTLGIPSLEITDAVVEYESGRVFVTGSYFGSPTVPGLNIQLPSYTNLDIFLAELDADTGAFLWAQGFGTNGPDFAVRLAVDHEFPYKMS